jgi:predicted ribosomally synthesized peptide with SipW-like signal peptide
MKLRNMKLRTVALSGVMSLASLGLIGAGAHAVFTTSTTSSQQITAGTLSLVLQATNPDGSQVSGYNTNSITFAQQAPVSSSFMTAPQLITIYNNGSVTATEISMQLTDPNAVANATSAALDSETWVCMYSDGELAFNEPMPTVEGYGSVIIGAQTIAPQATDSYTVVFYAGSADNGCGPTFTGISGGVYSHDEAYSGTPALGPNTDPLAVPLTNAAEGGTITPTFTVSYSG